MIYLQKVKGAKANINFVKRRSLISAKWTCPTCVTEPNKHLDTLDIF